MPKFGRVSTDRLATCDIRLQRIFNEVIKHVDCTVICGFRDEIAQENAVKAGASKVHWPDGKHNKNPSQAVDVMQYPVCWEETPANVEKMALFAGFVLGIAAGMGIELRWGHDWDRDNVPDNKGLVDRPHFELV